MLGGNLHAGMECRFHSNMQMTHSTNSLIYIAIHVHIVPDDGFTEIQTKISKRVAAKSSHQKFPFLQLELVQLQY